MANKFDLALVDTLPYLGSSPNELKQFKKTQLWQDIVVYITWRKEGTLQAMREATNPVDMYRAQGALEIADDILQLPDLLEQVQDLKTAPKEDVE